jgi:hypothetical protein
LTPISTRQIPDFVAGLFERAVEAGHSEKNVMALVKVLRSESGT